MSRLCRAPWTPEQVNKLNAYQISGGFHPYTSERGTQLIATELGWVEELGGPVVQDWAIASTFDVQPQKFPLDFSV